jgi:thioredoxin reductase
MTACSVSALLQCIELTECDCSACACAQTNEVSEIALRGIFYAIGHKPNTELFRNFISLDAAGYIKTEPGTPLTNLEGVFAAGDVQVSTTAACSV